MQTPAVTQLNSILLATDFSERSANAEAYALSLAETYKASLHLVSAIEPIMGVEPGDDDADEFEEFYARLSKRADSEVEKRIVTWQERNLIIKQHVEIGPRWKVILEYAAKRNVDLIVMGRRNYRSAEHASLGTTSQKIFFGAAQPVLFVPSDY